MTAVSDNRKAQRSSSVVGGTKEPLTASARISSNIPQNLVEELAPRTSYVVLKGIQDSEYHNWYIVRYVHVDKLQNLLYTKVICTAFEVIAKTAFFLTIFSSEETQQIQKGYSCN